MKNWLFLWQILTTVFRLLTPGGTRSIIAENIALRRQLLIMSRKQKRSPNLQMTDRLTFAWCAEHLSLQKLLKNAIIIKPETILKFHKHLSEKKYHQLYGSKPRKKSGPNRLLKFV